MTQRFSGPNSQAREERSLHAEWRTASAYSTFAPDALMTGARRFSFSAR
jgi:hypothetical protein